MITFPVTHLETSEEGGGDVIDTTKILRWWEGGDDDCKKTSTALDRTGDTITRTIGPFGTVWDIYPSVSSKLADFTDWEHFSIGLIYEYHSTATADWKFWYSTSFYDRIELKGNAGTPELEWGNNGLNVLSPASTVGDVNFLLYVRDGSGTGACRAYYNGAKTTDTAGSDVATAHSSFKPGEGKGYVAQMFFIDESLDDTQAAHIYNGGSFRAYADLNT